MLIVEETQNTNKWKKETLTKVDGREKEWTEKRRRKTEQKFDIFTQSIRKIAEKLGKTERIKRKDIIIILFWVRCCYFCLHFLPGIINNHHFQLISNG